MALTESSNDAAVPAVEGTHSSGGPGVSGASNSGTGVAGRTVTASGVHGEALRGIGVSALAHGPLPAADCRNDDTSEQAGPGLRARSRATGVIGESETWMGVHGLSQSTTGGHGVLGQAVGSGAGLWGDSTAGQGVVAVAHGAAPAAECVNDDTSDQAGPGLRARSRGAGVIGESTTWMGVFGQTQSSTGGHGVMGRAVGTGVGVVGESTEGTGVFGSATGPSTAAVGVRGRSTGSGPAIVGEHPTSTAVQGRGGFHGVSAIQGDPALQETTVSSQRAGLFAASGDGPGVVAYARNSAVPAILAFGGIRATPMGRPFAGEFLGDVRVRGDIMLDGADFAERFAFDVDDEAEAGDVVVIAASGRLRRSTRAYDQAVAGVVAGAGALRPGVVLTGDGLTTDSRTISLVGRAFCKVDAGSRPVRVGNLLTSSPTPGHAMVATDPTRAFGSVLGKALGRLDAGTGLVPILLCLQ